MQIGDHVMWKFRYGETHGGIVKIHSRDFSFMGRRRETTADSPQYKVMSEKPVKPLCIKLPYSKKFPIEVLGGYFNFDN